MEGALIRLEDIWMVRVEAEELTTILKHEAQAIRDETRTHAAIIRLNERDHHTVFIGHGEVSCIAVFEFFIGFRVTGCRWRHRLSDVDRFATCSVIARTNEYVWINPAKLSISIARSPVCKC